MIRVLVVDDHVALRDGLCEALEAADDIEIVGVAHHGFAARRLAADVHPDVVLMDLRMPIADGVTGTREVMEAVPWTRVVVLTALCDTERITEALRAGATGFLLKDCSVPELLHAIRAQAAGALPAREARRAALHSVERLRSHRALRS
jgi:DNA-binding NarL/FixJ family response regulator